MEQLGAGSRPEPVEALPEPALNLLQVHVDRTLAPGGDEDGLGQRRTAVWIVYAG